MRYLPHTPGDRARMLARIGAASLDDLFSDVPRAALEQAVFDLPSHQGEMAVEQALSALAAQNRPAGAGPCFLGAGCYRHHVPAAVDYLVQRGEFMTAYTPYQPEISQGTLQALFEFQTQVALLTGMEVANASMYDGATACAEAAAMATRVTRRSRVLMSGGLHPHYAAVTTTLLDALGHAPEALAPDPMGLEDLLGRVDSRTACVIVQTPDVFGRLRDLRALAEECHGVGALLVVAVTEPVSLGLIEPPGAMGADIVVAEGHALGSALSFGGPGVGLFATRDKLVRQMPGRLVGETVDEDGRRGFVLTLSTREQHIRREKATSNICTNAGLVALAFSIHLSLLGSEGLARLARINHQRALGLVRRLEKIPGVRVLPQAFFNEVAVLLPQDAGPVVRRLAQGGILAGVPGERLWPTYPELAPVLLIAATETNTDADLDALAAALTEALR
ncbi:aminomethyl-transferring glycine dehydrogenase subunit GcvPA [Pararhodospirillum photometricum]|uniref:Probable glycine dehydrogenase (decarboxylating) subunit 1 n=1 Tax=Pararhodospirillum photometricum DSM 122 TaxID=1150469 RepID=H6SM27_PARPM|nr:aminomethyl-transferring glycine dehydrogenase subunit GcvPA [Pararhodospirillum photometricum]CCG09042.1 Probable glycine dehydrogenase [decarboxylating] subunit 1 [Pararhodospirillum photometricum DSM 122]